MAILSNGKFYGFLCSVKETGRKLANGVKEYVEDFVSGFAGHGWKLWEYVKGKWMLEIDSIRIRGQFTVFELLIAQIRSIAGSQAITQGCAKVKSVTLVDAEVYREVSIPTYTEDFTDEKWVKSNVEVTNNTITKKDPTSLDGSMHVLFPNTIKKIRVKIENVTDDPFSGSYIHYRARVGERLTMEYNLINGEYDIDQSLAPPEGSYAGFDFVNISTDFVITQLPSGYKVENEITTEPCYRLEIENETNTISEYDLIRCQKGGKFYNVQVGNVSKNYIDIPVSEFDVDEEGNVVNPPEAGDEIVQFGNISHQDKYAGRHSAIYMHADDGQPAIDFMEDIYSKDWTDVVKTRIGGNLPGTNGGRGFYCVNGMIKGVSEDGTIVYQINPDGSGFLGRGGIKWEKDGYPQFSGTILVKVDENNVWEVDGQCIQTIGNKAGKRIELNPSTANMLFYDENNNTVSVFEGNEYSGIDDLLPVDTPVIESRNYSSGNQVESESVERSKEIDMITNIFYTDSAYLLKSDYTLRTSIGCYGNSKAEADIKIYIETYEDESLNILKQKVLIDQYYSGKTESYHNTKLIPVPKGYSKVSAITHYITQADADNTCYVGFSVEYSGIIELDAIVSRHFANGILVGASRESFLSLFCNKTEEGYNTEFNVVNGDYRLSLDNKGINIMNDGRWGMMSNTIMRAKVDIVSGSPAFSAFHSFDGRSATIKKIDVGYYTIDFPEEWKKLGINGRNAYVIATGYGISNLSGPKKPVIATSWVIATDYFTILISDRTEMVDAGFSFELKWI